MWILLCDAFCTLMAISKHKEAHLLIEWLQGFFILHSTIDSTAHSRPLYSLEHRCKPSTSAFRATTGPNEPWSGLEMLYCQQLASPTECVLIKKHTINSDTSLYITLPGPLRGPAGTLPMWWRCPPDIPYTLRPPAGSRDGYLRATDGPR